DHIPLSKTIFAGLYYFNINTSVNSLFLLGPTGLTRSGQTIDNNTIFAHALKAIGKQYYFDLAGAFGQNKLHTRFINFKNELALASNSNTSWFITGNGIYRKTLNKLTFRANLSV